MHFWETFKFSQKKSIKKRGRPINKVLRCFEKFESSLKESAGSEIKGAED